MSIVLNFVAKLLLFLLILTPVVFFNSLYYPAVTSKAVYFFGLTQFVFLLYIIKTFFLDRVITLPKISVPVLASFSFVLMVGVANIFGENSEASFFSDFERVEGFVTIFHLGLFFWLLCILFQTDRLWESFFIGSLATSVVVFLVALNKYIEVVKTEASETRVDVLLGNATFLGAYAMLNIFIALFIAVRKKSFSVNQMFFYFIALLNLGTIIFSGTRAAILGLLGGIVIGSSIYFFRTDKIKLQQKIIITISIVAIFLFGFFYVINHKEQMQDVPIVGRFLHLTPDTIKEQPRYFIWSAAVQGFLDRPILGWGQERFATVYDKYYSPETKSRFNVAIGEPWIDRTHNVYLEWLVAGGVTVFILYMLLIISLFYVIFRRCNFNDIEISILVGFLVSYLVNNLFAFDSISTYILFFSFIGYLHFKSEPLVIPQNFITFGLKNLYVRRIFGFILIILIFTFSVYTVRLYDTSKNLATFLKADSNFDKLKAFEDIEKSSLYAPWHVFDALAKDLSQEVVRPDDERNIEMENKMISFIDENGQTYDLNAKTLLFYCRALRQSDKIEKALGSCLEAAKKAPNTQVVLVELALVYREQGLYEESLEVLEKNYRNEPNFDPSRFQYALALLYTKKTDKAKSLLQERYNTHIIDNKDLLLAYAHVEQYESALEIANKHLKEYPNDIGYHISRISIYLKMNEEKLAIKAVEDFMKVDARFEKIGKDIIEKIKSGQDVLGSTLSI